MVCYSMHVATGPAEAHTIWSGERTHSYSMVVATLIMCEVHMYKPHVHYMQNTITFKEIMQFDY